MVSSGDDLHRVGNGRLRQENVVLHGELAVVYDHQRDRIQTTW